MMTNISKASLVLFGDANQTSCDLNLCSQNFPTLMDIIKKCSFGPNYEACAKYSIAVIIVIKVINPSTKEKSHLRLHFSTYDENKTRSF